MLPRLGTCFSAWLVLDTEEIAKFCKSLSISEDDGKVVSLYRSLVLLGKRQMQNYLVGKILTNKKANMEAFKAVIHDVWKTVKIVMIECVGDNLLLFQFNSDGDKKREIALFLGKQTREVEDVEVRSYGDFTGRFLRLRVIIDATKPLRKCIKLLSPELETKVIILLVRVSSQNHEETERVQLQPFVQGEDEAEHGNVPDHGSLHNDGSKWDNTVTLGNHYSSIASGAFNEFGGEAISEEDNTWEANLRVETEGVIDSIRLPNQAVAHTVTYEKGLIHDDNGNSGEMNYKKPIIGLRNAIKPVKSGKPRKWPIKQVIGNKANSGIGIKRHMWKLTHCPQRNREIWDSSIFSRFLLSAQV
ncbi:hypothetical protein WN943_023634 [Citrus x changshan-huyou]